MGSNLNVSTSGNCQVAIGGKEGGGHAEWAVADAGDVGHDVDVAAEDYLATRFVIQDKRLHSLQSSEQYTDVPVMRLQTCVSVIVEIIVAEPEEGPTISHGL